MTHPATQPSYLLLFREGRATLSIAILLSVTLVALDVLIVNTVLPTILRELGGISLYAWAIGSYSLGNFITIPIFSVSVTKVGGRLSFILAVFLFMAGAIVAAFAPNMVVIVAGRLIQGLGAGGFFAIPFTIISTRYPSDLQPRAVGLISAVWGSAAVAGPLIGAGILEIAGWKWVFLFNIPAGILILALGLWALRREALPPLPQAKINWRSPLLFAIFTALLLESFHRPLPWNLILLLLSGLVFLGFWKIERKHPIPIIPRDAWSLTRPLGVAFLGMALTTATFGGAETYLPLILQGIWEATPLQAGLILTVGSISWSLTSVAIAPYADHPRRLTLSGSSMIAMGISVLFLTLFFNLPVFWIYLGWFVAGMGIGQVVPTYNTLSMDVAKKYPSGVSTGALLLALTWGFAVGGPLAGLAARIGFEDGFVPSRLGLGALTQQSWEALRSGGIYSLLVCIGIGIGAAVLAFRIPARRLN